MLELAIKNIASVCSTTILVYVSALIIIVWATVRTYQYFAAENVRAKRLKKLILLMVELCNPQQAAWLVDDSRNSKPPKEED